VQTNVLIKEECILKNKNKSCPYKKLSVFYNTCLKTFGSHLVCKASHKRWRDNTHVCDQTCSDCAASPPRARSPAFAYPATNVTDISEVGRFSRTISRALQKKSVCERKRCCATCGLLVTDARHECNKVFSANCKEKRDACHLCYMRPLKDALPDASDKVVYVFYDFESTQNIQYSDKATIHVPHLVCVQRFCSQCEDAEDCGECVRCGQRVHSFWDDPVGDLLTCLCRPRPWANKIVAIANNAKAFDLHFILNRAIMLKWKPEQIMSGVNIMCMKMEHFVFLDSVSFFPCALRKLPEAFGLQASKSW